jgi:hypothetical protein
MPTLGIARREVDGAALAALVSAWSPGHAYLEKVGSRPGQGVRSMFSFGLGDKRIENRIWSPPDWMCPVGTFLAIHAGKKVEKEGAKS